MKSSLNGDDLALILPLILDTGTAGLAWRKIRGTRLALTEAGREIQAARRIQAVESAVSESQIERLLTNELRDFDPVLAKGWGYARLYPEAGLRPYCDIDLLVRPDRVVDTALAGVTAYRIDPGRPIPVDVQTVTVDLPDRTWGDIRAHAREQSLRGLRLRVLGPEDSLRLSCLHFVRHATEMPPRSNPLWLCDLGVLLENLPVDFDWDYCLAGQPWRTDWMLAVVRLSNQVLGVDIDQCPGGSLPVSVPAWMAKTFLRIWGRGERYIPSAGFPLPFVRVREDIRELPRALAERWPSPLQSVSRLAWPINRVSGRVAQVVDYGGRALSWGPRHAGLGRSRATSG